MSMEISHKSLVAAVTNPLTVSFTKFVNWRSYFTLVQLVAEEARLLPDVDEEPHDRGRGDNAREH